jgi:hypothetical protein
LYLLAVQCAVPLIACRPSRDRQQQERLWCLWRYVVRHTPRHARRQVVQCSPASAAERAAASRQGDGGTHVGARGRGRSTGVQQETPGQVGAPVTTRAVGKNMVYEPGSATQWV